MKGKVLTIFVSISLLLMSCVRYERASTNWFNINIPKGSSIVTESDGISLKAEIKNTANTQIFIEALPAEVSIEDAFKLIGKKYPVSMLHHSYPYPENFDYSQVKGIRGVYIDELLKGEDYCFQKDGYTVYACSYGRKVEYQSIREIIRSIDFNAPPYSFMSKKGMVSYLKKALPNQIKAILSGMMPEDCVCNDVLLIEENGCWNFECILDGVKIKTTSSPYGITNNNYRTSRLASVMLSPSIYNIESPLLYTAHLLGINYSFKFLNPDDTPIVLKRD